jgi:zinc protease
VLAGVDGRGFRPAVELERQLAGYPLAPPDPGLSISPAAVQAVVSRSLAANAVVFGIGGKISRQEAQAALDTVTDGWPAGEAPTRAAVSARQAAQPQVKVDAPSLEGWLAIGRVLDAVPVAEQPALAVMADILNNRLNIASREMRGLTNRNNFLLPGDATDHAGLMHIRSGGRPEAVAPLVQVSHEEIRRLRDTSDTVSAEELDRAKGALVFGTWQTRLDGVRAASATYASELLRYGSLDRLRAWPAAIQAVTADQVKEAADRYLDPAQMATVVVGPMDRIAAAKHPRWPATLD